MRALFEFGKKTAVPFVVGFAANKMLEMAYDGTRDLMVDKDLENEVKNKKMELQIAENKAVLKDQQKLIALQKQHSQDLSEQVQRKLFELDDLQKKTKY